MGLRMTGEVKADNGDDNPENAVAYRDDYVNLNICIYQMAFHCYLYFLHSNYRKYYTISLYIMSPI